MFLSVSLLRPFKRDGSLEHLTKTTRSDLLRVDRQLDEVDQVLGVFFHHLVDKMDGLVVGIRKHTEFKPIEYEISIPFKVIIHEEELSHKGIKT